MPPKKYNYIFFNALNNFPLDKYVSTLLFKLHLLNSQFLYDLLSFITLTLYK